MAFYESVFIARQDLTPAQIESLSSDIANIIGKQGGKVTKTEPWGVKPLATRINKSKKAHYVLLNIDAPPEAVAEMERNMRLHEDILRYLTVRVDDLEEGPSVMLRKSNDNRDEPGAPGARPQRDFGGGGFRGGDRDRGPGGGDKGYRPRPPRAKEGEES